MGYETEHILELQLLGLFLKDRQEKDDTEYSDPIGPDKIGFCKYFEYYWYKRTSLINNKMPVQAVFEQYPSKTANTGEFVLLVDGVNTAKKGVCVEKFSSPYHSLSLLVDPANLIAT